MKIKLFLASLCLLFLVSCDYFAPLKLKSTTKDYLVNEVLQDKSYKVEVKKIVYDTIPLYYLPVYDKVLNFSGLTMKLIDELNSSEGEIEDLEEQCKKIKNAQRDAKLNFTMNSVEYTDHKSYIVHAKASKSKGGDSQKFVVVIDKDGHVINHIKFDEDFKYMIIFLHMALTMPVEIDDDGVIDFDEFDNWLKSNNEDVKLEAERFYLKNLKYFN